MKWLRWVIVVLAVAEAGWMAFDGTRALVVGDYVTPAEGEFAGQLGPWSQVVRAAGIEPRSTWMKAIFVGYGLAWLGIVAAFVFRRAPWTDWAMLVAALGALWYLPVGTVFSLIQTGLFWLRRLNLRPQAR